VEGKVQFWQNPHIMPHPVELADTTTASEPPSPGEMPRERPREIDGPQGPDPTRYGDWERNGRCIDF